MSDHSGSSFDILNSDWAFLKGIVGAGAPILAVLNSFQEQVEWYLRVAGLVGGVIVSILTICSFFKKRK